MGHAGEPGGWPAVKYNVCTRHLVSAKTTPFERVCVCVCVQRAQQREQTVLGDVICQHNWAKYKYQRKALEGLILAF